jgi:hypothetical protein
MADHRLEWDETVVVGAGQMDRLTGSLRPDRRRDASRHF